MNDDFIPTTRIDKNTKTSLKLLAKQHDRKFADEVRHALKKYVLNRMTAKKK